MDLKKSKFLLTLLVILSGLLALTSCGAPNASSQSSTFTRTVDDIDFRHFTDIREQAEFAQTQKDIILDDLGIINLGLPPVTPDNLDTQAASETLTWHNPHDYYRNLPQSAKETLDKVLKVIWQENPELQDIPAMTLAEFSQLVPESTKDKVQKDVIGLFTISGGYSDKAFDWIASVAVKFDDFTIRSVSINPSLGIEDGRLATKTHSVDNHFLPALMLLKSSEDPVIYGTRRVISDEVYNLLAAEGSFIDVNSITSSSNLPNQNLVHPQDLSIIGIYSDGELQEIEPTNGVIGE